MTYRSTIDNTTARSWLAIMHEPDLIVFVVYTFFSMCTPFFFLRNASFFCTGVDATERAAGGRRRVR